MSTHRNQTHASDNGTATKRVGHVLVIDDELPICEIARDILEEVDLNVETALVAEEGLQLVKDNPEKFDLVILDLAMPTMNGEKLVRELHAIRPSLKLIVSSGHQSRLPAEELYRLGVVALMPKPYGAKNLIRLVKSALGGEVN